MSACQLWLPDPNPIPILPWIDGSYTTSWDTTVTDRQKAERTGALPKFVEQEDAFLKFYNQLFRNGVFRRTGRRQAYGEGQIVWHSGWDRRLKKAVRKMVGDVGWHGIYVPQFQVRIVGHHDRTDVLFFENEAHVAKVASLAQQHGLFLI